MSTFSAYSPLTSSGARYESLQQSVSNSPSLTSHCSWLRSKSVITQATPREPSALGAFPLFNNFGKVYALSLSIQVFRADVIVSYAFLIDVKKWALVTSFCPAT